MIYWFIGQHSSSHGVQKMCRVLGVSRSGYYRWKKPEGKRRKGNDEVLVKVKEIYHKNEGRYGSPRITEGLRANGNMYGENRIARLMRENGIMAKTVRKFKATTNSKHNLPVAENLLKQYFTAQKPNTAWYRISRIFGHCRAGCTLQ